MFRHRDGVLDPWGTIYFGGAARGPERDYGFFLLLEMLVFMFILAVGYVYVWKPRGVRVGLKSSR